MRQQKLFLLFIFFTIYFAFHGVVFASDLNGNGIQDIDEAEVVISSNVSLPAGEYFFKNLTITNNATLTLIGDPLSVNSFKGVKIIAVNLTINSGSSISADEKGYSPGSGPGASAGNRAGASYGGVGGWGGVSIYGSAIKPLDLGSGGPYTGRGGGAVYIMVAGIFTNNGIVSANGGGSSSGGSIYVITGDIGGSGTFKANGGSYSSSSVYYGQGGGGRIAIYYQASSFSGQTIASGGCGSLGMGYTYECGGSGTSGLFNLSTNDFYAGPSWHFQKNDEPFNFNNIYISNAAKVTSENGANITANNVIIDKASQFTLADNQILNISTITVDGNSTLTLSGSETITANSLTIKGNSTVTVIPGKILSLIIPNISISFGASISAYGKGYGSNQGPGTSPLSSTGASYGGLSVGGIATSIYGSATKPVDFGSGGNSYGGGAIRIIVSDIFTNNGVVSADGNISSSGGSIYVTAKNITGSGVLRANGGGLYASGYFKSPGGGGRIAVYYHASSFNGTMEVKGGCGSYDGWSMICAGAGTVGIFDESTNNLYVNSSWQFRKNDSPFNFNNIYISNAAKVTSEDGANITANNITIDGASIFTLSGNEIINTNNFLITGNSMVSVIPERILTLTIPNITINSGSKISADSLGYIIGPGSPTVNSEAGASYGGVGGGITAKPVYGSATEPVNFGSGTEGHHGGGAIRLIVNNTLQNDGIISANGIFQRVSGGSIYINANKIKGGGAFQANGGNSGWPYGPIGGGGGRIAIYYQDSFFTGAATAKAGVYCFYGCAPAAENGTVLIQSSVPVCVTDCFSNILFLPGIMGSRLYETGLDCGAEIIGPECGEKELWVSTNDTLQEKLALNTQGKSINNLFTKNDTQKLDTDSGEKGIIDEISGLNIYKSFITDLKNWKQDGTIADYSFIPYDWRLSLDDIITNGATNSENNLSYTNSQNFSESFILKKLEALQKNSKSGKVTIISHSNGGLVAKALIQKLKDTNNPLYDKIDKIIFVAVPQVGTPDAMATLLHGSEIGPAGLIMSNERSRQLSENMSSVYNFLPTVSYFTTVDPAFAIDKVVSFENKPFFNPQTSQYGIYVSNETELKNYVLGTDGRTKPSFGDTVHPNIGNSLLYAQAENVHQILDAWQPSSNTKVIQVAGWGEETLAGLDYKLYKNFFGSEYFSFEPRWVVDGDGAVVAPSALWMSDTNPNVERWWVDLKEYNNQKLFDTKHRDILEIPNLLDFIKSKVTDSSFTDPDNFVVNNNSTLVSNDTRLHYTLHSPLTLGIEAQGKYTGMDPITKQIREEIPNVAYRQIGDVQFLSAPDDIAYTVEMHGYQEGSFSLDVEKQEGNIITDSTSFQGIPSSASTVATIDIVPNSEVSNTALKIDQNGDGITDKTLDATPNGITIYDVTPPELQVTFDINTKDVVFSAQDAIDKNPTIITTKIPTTLTDNAGNTTVIPFIKYKEKPTKLRFSYNKIIRNGIIITVPNTSVVYDWQEKKGVLTDLDTKITIKGVEKYIFSYNKASNITTIKEKIGKNITTTKREGFVAVTLKTSEDYLNVSY